MIILTFLILGLGLFIWRKVIKDYDFPLNHVNLFSVSWLFVLFGSLVFPLEVELKYSTINVMLLAWISFLIASFKFKRSNHTFEIENDNLKIEYNLIKLKYVLYALLFFSIIAYLLNLSEVFAQMTSLESWSTVRTDDHYKEAANDNLFFTLFARNYSIYVPIAIYLFHNKTISKIEMSLVFSYGLLTSVINFSRAPLLELLSVSLVCFLLIKGSKKIPIFRILLMFLILVFFFITTQSILVADTVNFSDVLYQIKMYLFGGVNNFHLILDGKYIASSEYESGFYSFDFINYILQRIGVIDTYPSLVREFNSFTMSNVYTYLDCFVLDFGLLGAIIGPFLLGFVGKYLYFNYLRIGSLSSFAIYGLICYYFVMTFMNNEFIRFSFLLFVIKILLIDWFVNVRKFKFKW